MKFVKTRTQKSGLGYKQFYRQYQAQNCEGCPMRGPCHKGKDNRKIDANTKLIHYKQEIREKLNSERGQHYRSRRPVDVEAVFGNIKYNHNFKRFLLRGMEKVEIEIGLISLAQNMRKMAN